MALDTLTDADIAELLLEPKSVRNPGARERTDGKHRQRDFDVVSDDERHRFVLFTRQSTVIPTGFSAGLRWCSKTGDEIMLLRCNGPDHPHVNVLERARLDMGFHVHRATERYIQAGRRAEGWAEATNAYRTLTGALHHLVTLANIRGIETAPDEADLFDHAR